MNVDGAEEQPLSYVQQRLWLSEQINGPSAAHTVPLAVRLTGPVNRGALRAAWSDVVARHETLRSVFGDHDGTPFQRVLPAGGVPVDLPVRDVPEPDLPAVLAAQAGYRFDLTQRPPWHAELLAIAPEHHVLVVLMHHIIVDGWSIKPLLGDLAAAYRARAAGRQPPLPPLARRYSDFVRWQRTVLEQQLDEPDGAPGQQLAYWTDALRGAPARLPLPVDRPGVVVRSSRGGSLARLLPAQQHRALAEFARSVRATLFMVLHAGVAAVLTRFGAGNDIVVGCPVAGRTAPGFDQVVGPFVNILVLRLNTGGGAGFRELVRRARQVDLMAYAHQDLPFERLVSAINPPRVVGQHPVFQVELVGHNMPQPDRSFAGLRHEVELLGAAAAKTDLSFHLTDRYRADGVPDGIEVAVVYSSDLFSADTARRLLAELAGLLDVALRLPEVPVEQLSIAPPPD